jgi:hypothetical protein
MKIYEAAQQVLKENDAPMSADSIYSEIVRNGLFVFRAKDPKGVLKKTLRKKSLGENPVFLKLENGKYELI